MASNDEPFEYNLTLNYAPDDAPDSPPLHTNVQDNSVFREVPSMLGGLPMPTAVAYEIADRVQNKSFDVSDLGSRVTLNEDGTCQLSDDVHCYHPLYRPHGCYEGRGINFKQVRNGRIHFYICDQCGDKWNQIPFSNLKPGENPKFNNNSKRRTDATDPTRCGGYQCTSCGLKKNKKLASELGVQHCVCPKKEKDAADDENIGMPGLQPIQAPPALLHLPMPMRESDAAKQAAEGALEAVRVCRMMGGAQFSAVDVIADSVHTKKKMVTAEAVQPIVVPPVKRTGVVVDSMCKTTAPQTTSPARVMAVTTAAPLSKKSRIRVTQLASVSSSAFLISEMRLPAKEKEVYMTESPIDAGECDDDDGDTNCTYCGTTLDKDHQIVSYSVNCIHRKCNVCVCLSCAGFQSIKQARRTKQWFCRGHQA